MDCESARDGNVDSRFKFARPQQCQQRGQTPLYTTIRKSDPKKVLVASRLRSQTSVSLRWIANRLEMGTWTHGSNLLGRSSVNSEDRPLFTLLFERAIRRRFL